VGTKVPVAEIPTKAVRVRCRHVRVFRRSPSARIRRHRSNCPTLALGVIFSPRWTEK